MEVIWHGTAAVEIVHSSGRILFDPFVPLSGSDVDVRLEDFDGFTDILVTHGHLDHIVHIPEIVRRNPTTTVYCTRTPFQTLLKKGVPEANLKRIDYGQKWVINGFQIHVFHGCHAVLPKARLRLVLSLLCSKHRKNLPYIIWENRLCRENNETVFYQIEADGESISLMGSMNMREDVDYPTNADVLVLPYNGWEDNFPPAVRTIERLKPKKVLLDHYDDTFPPLTSPLDLSPILGRYGDLVIPMKHFERQDRHARTTDR